MAGTFQATIGEKFAWYDHEKLRNPDVAGTFQATLGEKFAPLISLRDDDTDIDSMVLFYSILSHNLGRSSGHHR